MDFSGRGREVDVVLAALEGKERKEPPISDEEKARRYEIGRNYVIGKFREHNELNHDLACKIQLKKHAIKMLPRNRPKVKEAALAVDDRGPPLWRHLAKWTPPIPGFNADDLFEKKDD